MIAEETVFLLKGSHHVHFLLDITLTTTTDDEESFLEFKLFVVEDFNDFMLIALLHQIWLCQNACR